ncbi:MAG: hypothetical protein KJ737_15530 [Proteobacteria bacterium]|nr:hypothetical protein [Pseudomonadota bacterium]
MKMKYLWHIIFSVMMAAVPAYSADKSIKNEAELSYLETGGNTETVMFKAKNALTWAINDKVNMAWFVAGLYGESDNTKIAVTH